MDANLHLPTPSEFPAFPYSPPYDIQIDLMRHLYESIESGKVAILESPTGTVSEWCDLTLLLFYACLLRARR
jgi:chromosome transmission fidelity protein 1